MAWKITSLCADQLASFLTYGKNNLLVIDSRSFLEYNDSHVLDSVNIGCSKLIKRRLINNKVSINELLKTAGDVDTVNKENVVVYDQSSDDVTSLPSDNFVAVVLSKLASYFPSVYFLKGGFADFGKLFPTLCERHHTCPSGNSSGVFSTPCLASENVAPTKILPFLYLGSQEDSLKKELLKDFSINYVLNVSQSCPMSENQKTGHCLRIPVRDSGTENIVDWFDKAFDFIDKVQEGNGRVLVHCYAGVSRSATIAIGYVMKHFQMTLDEAYRFVKEKRPTISPNLNFMGQLMQYEKRLASKQPHKLVWCVERVSCSDMGSASLDQPKKPLSGSCWSLDDVSCAADMTVSGGHREMTAQAS